MAYPLEERQCLQISEQLRWTSPFPPPQVLEAYNNAVPGLTDKIVAQVEAQAAHRIGLENKVTSSDIHRSWAGVACGFLLSLSCVAGGVACVLYGHDAAGATIATGAVGGLAAVFIYGTAKQKEERAERAKLMMSQRKPETT